VLDDFTGSGSCVDPEGSGSTKGTVGAATTFIIDNLLHPGTTFDATKKKPLYYLQMGYHGFA
jgi:hypothetical protein